MPLPGNNTAWPPTAHLNRYNDMRVNAIWYEGDPHKLSTLYAGGTVESVPAEASMGVARRVYRTVKRWFWGVETAEGERDTKIHVPIAEDIATLSSELLFAESPVVKLDPPKKEPVVEIEHSLDALGQDHPKEVTKEQEDPALQEHQETLEWLLDRIGWHALLLAAAETQSPLGSVCLRIAWDKEVDDKAPFLVRVDADAAVPEYRWGKLVALTFWRVIRVKDEEYVRHLERYEPGKIYHGVYSGTRDNLGIAMPLGYYEETMYLVDQVNEEGFIPAPEGMLMATSIPNRLPDPSDRQAVIGRSDYSPGVLTLMDAVDEIATSLMRDIDLGKGRVFLARYMLEDKGAGKGAEFNSDQRYFSPLNTAPSDDESKLPIVASQFQIRVDEHLRSIEWYAAKAIRAAGYNPDADYGDDGEQMTATEYTGKNRRSFSTRNKKILYWTQALEQIVEALIRLWNAEFAGQDGRKAIPEDWPVRVEFPPAAHPDIKVLAETANLMKQAESASLKIRVQLLHPDWTDREIDEEVDRIKEETTTVNPDTFGLDVGGDEPPEVGTPSPFEEDTNGSARAGGAPRPGNPGVRGV